MSRDDVEFSPKYMIFRPPVNDYRPLSLNAILREYVIMMKMIESVFPPFFLSFIKKLYQKRHFAKFQMVQCGLAWF